jgi:hypothetical protein
MPKPLGSLTGAALFRCNDQSRGGNLCEIVARSKQQRVSALFAALRVGQRKIVSFRFDLPFLCSLDCRIPMILRLSLTYHAASR